MNMEVFQGQSSSTHFPRGTTLAIKQEEYGHPLYATPVAPNAGAVALVHETAHPDQGYRTASSINFTGSGSSVAVVMMASQKRPSSGEPGTPAKHVKSEHPEEFSQQVKKKLQSSTRTGQACDRCKVRKIRCDGLPGGCSPCLQNNTPCQTTDRITGRATQRGYVEGLEQRSRDLENRVRELEQLVRQGGAADIRPPNGYSEVAASSYDYNQSIAQAPAPWNPVPVPHSQHSNSAIISNQQQEPNLFLRDLPAFRAGCIGDNYLGVATGNSHLSSIKGTALSILGMEINIADFRSIDMDEPDPSISPHPQLYNKSYQAFLQTALNINSPLEKPSLPGRAEGFTYVEWYFRVVNPYMPLLHRPTLLRLLTSFYDDPTFRPTTAETVIVHMVFAIMFFQYATRNVEDSSQQANLNHQSNIYYHYCLGKFYQLSCSHTFHDVQALTLICAHLRNFPKPGASWILTQTTMALAIELGLHRSSKRWAKDASPNALDVEMRKRTFWALLTIHVTLSGKLGRPMTLRIEDFDVEMPEAYDDDLLSEKGLDTTNERKCAHEIGLQAIPLLPLFMEMYSTVYAVRPMSTEGYIATIDRLESKIRAWQEGLPRSLVQGESGQTEQEGRVFALYAEMWALEFRLLLRHPSVSLSKDEAFNAESMRVCMECSRKMLSTVRQLQRFKSLDTTWYSCAVYVMAITTTLFAQWEKRERISAADLAALREEMDIWLDIMGDVGALLGSGNRLRDAIRVVTDGTLDLLAKMVPAKNVAYLQHNKTIGIAKSPVQSANTYLPPQNYNYVNDATAAGNPTSTSNYLPGGSQLTHQQTPYPTATQYSSYSESPTPLLAYTPQENPQAYNAYAESSETPEGTLLASFATQASQAQVPANNWQRSPPTNSGSNAWHQWTTAITGNLEPQDCYSANALMQLGGRELADGNENGLPRTSVPGISPNSQTVLPEQAVVNNDNQMGAQVNGSIGMTWPLNIFDVSQTGSSS